MKSFPIACLSTILVLVFASSCCNPQKVKTPAETFDAVEKWPEYPDAELCALRSRYFARENAQHRASEFHKLALCLLYRISDKNARRITLNDLSWLFGPPDLIETAQESSRLVYNSGANSDKDYAVVARTSNGYLNNIDMYNHHIAASNDYHPYLESQDFPKH